jgi:hypothetical protein
MVATVAVLGFAGAASVSAVSERVGRLTTVAAWTVAHASPVGLDAAPTMVLATAALVLLLWAGARLVSARQLAPVRALTRTRSDCPHANVRRAIVRTSRQGGLYGP